MKLYSPLEFPTVDSWTIQTSDFTVPSGSGFRYEGYVTYGIEATWTGNGQSDIKSPTAAIVRHYALATGNVLEVEILPFEIRQAVQTLPFGLPVFYMYFELGTPSSVIKNGQSVEAGDILGKAEKIKFCAVMPDRIVRDPLYWSDELYKAFQSTGCDIADWKKFFNRIKGQIGAKAPVLLLDHRGAPLESGSFTISPGNHTLTLQKGDRGNIQKKFKDSTGLSLWNLSNLSVQPKPAPGSTSDFQLACIEDKTGTDKQKMIVTPDKRHILVTNLHAWFAPQYAKLVKPPHLQRYSRGNQLTPLINGKEFFPDLFKALHQACGQGGGFHVAGWYMIPDRFLPDPIPGASKEFRTLKNIIKHVGTANQVSCCFLPAKFFTLKSEEFAYWETVAVVTVAMGLYCIKALNLNIYRTDGSGVAVLALVMFGNAALMGYLGSKKFKDIELNDDAIDQLHQPPPGGRSKCYWSPYPATIWDNPLRSPNEKIIKAILTTIEHFNIYHQKLAVVRTINGEYIGYCGGMDLNPNRRDDEYHVNPQPYHDVHARVIGPAVRDLSITFQQRWEHDGEGSSAFAPPDLVQLDKSGKMVVQVARTYFKTKDNARKLKFAPQGDRTIVNTILQAIKAAQQFIYIEDQYFTPPEEYQKVLLEKVEKGKIEKLIVVVPALTDQPFGEKYRDEFVTKLLDADSKKEIVQIGYPRRRYTVPRCDLRASSGKMILMKELEETDTDIKLGPFARIPKPPFWISVDGELIWVYDELSPLLDPQKGKKTIGQYKVDRGENTCIVSGIAGEEKGSSLRAHKAGAAVTLVELSGINVHAKLMIVDDLFLSVGSANLNRRGFYSDGETNLFAVPEALQADPTNPVRVLRKRLWAEMMDLPYTLVEPLLNDPVISSELFKRSYFMGNRFVPLHTIPKDLFGFQFRGSDSLASNLLQKALMSTTAVTFERLWDNVVDPSSDLQPKSKP